jgi:hypothetical protein
LAAPLHTLLAIRTEGPRARNELELDFLARTHPIKIFRFEYDHDESPLSWHLSSMQRALIVNAWPGRVGVLEELRQFLEGPPPGT